MSGFEIGMVSLVLAIVFPAAYFVSFKIRQLSAWSKREAGPNERIGFFLLLTAVFGFVVGSFAQPQWNKGVECKATGRPVLTCVLFSQ